MNVSSEWGRLFRHSRIAFGATCVVLIGVLILVTDFFGATPSARRLEGTTMGTYYSVVYGGDVAPSQLHAALKGHLSAIEDQLSNWDRDSWISRFNDSRATYHVGIPKHAHRVLQHSLALTRHTEGALDPTLGQLINLWGFGPIETHSLPNDQSIHKALQATGPSRVTLKDGPPRIAKLHPDLRLNLSSVAKGYAVDVLAQHLETEDIFDYMVNIGGDLRTNGRPPNQAAWTVAIQKPDPEARGDEVHDALDLNEAGVATSGDYRRFHESGGRHYHHIIDSETGRPVETDLASATVIASTAMQADGLATACVVLGLGKARELIERTSGAEALFIQRAAPNEFRTVTSSGWPEPGGKTRKSTTTD